jgi:uncharacterized protein (DUF305 family)
MTTTSMRARALRAAAALTLLATVSVGCRGSGDGNAGDTAGATGSAVAAGDSGGMAGMDHGPAKDADHEFLRKMSDHHEGLVQMASAAMNKASAQGAQADAHRLHTKQAEERDRMVGIIRTAYSETHQPTVMPNNKAMNDSLQAMPRGSQYDREFYRHVIMHHREGMQMIDQFLPRLTKPEVRQMAERMRADQTREIAEFERKTGGRA